MNIRDNRKKIIKEKMKDLKNELSRLEGVPLEIMSMIPRSYLRKEKRDD